MSLPRTSEHLIRDYVKFRVGQIVYASVSPDETMIGFGFPKEEREAMIASRPDVFVMPRLSDQRYQWIVARMAALGKDEMTELIIDAWRMVVPKKVAAAHLGVLANGYPPTPDGWGAVTGAASCRRTAARPRTSQPANAITSAAITPRLAYSQVPVLPPSPNGPSRNPCQDSQPAEALTTSPKPTTLPSTIRLTGT